MPLKEIFKFCCEPELHSDSSDKNLKFSLQFQGSDGYLQSRVDNTESNVKRILLR